jgi:hypothetical protein
MKTVVFQSFRTTGVPDWITTCMGTVRAWAERNGFEYRFFDDEFLALAPDWYRERCRGEMCPVTDLARLVKSRDLLAAGYQRTVWVDADVLVFAPERLRIDAVEDFGFCYELWPYADSSGRLCFHRRANNSITVFTESNRQLDFLIDACLRLARSGRIHKLSIGAHLVSGLAQLLPIQLVANAGIFSPLLMLDIAQGAQGITPAYAAQLPGALGAANLCGSLVGRPTEGFIADEAAYRKVVETCLATAGEVVNRYCTPEARAR